jgi:hypothetical protein
VAEDAVEIVVIGGPLLLPQVLNPDAPLTGSRLLLGRLSRLRTGEQGLVEIPLDERDKIVETRHLQLSRPRGASHRGDRAAAVARGPRGR